MSSVGAIPKLKLFPLYPGGPVIQNTGGLNAYSDFTIPATRYTPAYGVNQPPQSQPMQDTFFRVNRNGGLESRPLSEARAFNRSIAVDPTVTGYLGSAKVPAVAPQSPDIYRDILALYSITDLKFSELMTPNNQFRIPELGMGLQVTTDAAGDVSKIELRPSMQKAIPGFGSQQDAGYFLLNRSEIMYRATLNAAPTPIVPGSGPPVPSNAQAQPTGLQNGFNPFNLAQLQPNSGLFGLGAAGKPELFDLGGLREQAAANPVLERLLQLQPQEPGVPVSGPEAELDVDQARRLAASNAGLDVTTTERFKANLIALVNGAKDAWGSNPLQLAQARDGQIPMAPSLPAGSRSTVELGGTFANTDSFQAGAGVADALDKKSRGGYLPFQMNSGAGNPFGGFDGSAAFGGYSQRGFGPGAQAGGGGSQQQASQQRRPLAYTA